MRWRRASAFAALALVVSVVLGGSVSRAITDLGGGSEYLFTDVDDSHPFFESIEWLVDEEIASGYADGSFRPGVVVSRQSFAAFLYGYDDPTAFTPPVTPTFVDVPTDHQFFTEIEWLADAGITGGYPDGGFHPTSAVSRQSAAAFLYSYDEPTAFTPPVTPTFVDVPTDHQFFTEIEWLADAGITSGYPDGGFHPTSAVSRQSAAAFLHRYDAGPPPAPVVAALLAGGGLHSCAVTSVGGIDCWGANSEGVFAAPDGTGFVGLAADQGHTCALTDVGGIVCWGLDSWGRLDAPSGSGYLAIAAGQYHGCAITSTGSIDCWGRDHYGQATPPAGTGYTNISAGQYHTCALTVTGSIDCWGQNSDGQTDAPAGVGNLAIAAGWSHTCAITSTGSLDCWGDNTWGQTDTPTGVGNIEITAGISHTCARSLTGHIKCWGRDVPVDPVDGGHTHVAAGNDHTCAITATGNVTCWGKNNSGAHLGGLPFPGSPPANPIQATLAYTHTWDLTHDTVDTTWAVTTGALPSGLTIDPTTGTITGTPITAGTYPITITTTNLFGSVSTAATITVTPAATITGTITHSITTAPVAGATVAAYTPTDPDGTPTATTTTAPDGTYTLTGLPNGPDYRIHVTPPDGTDLHPRWYQYARQRANANWLSITPGTAHTDINIALTANATITGTVLDTSAAIVAGATITAYIDNEPDPVATTTTALDGTWTLDALPSGHSHRLLITPPPTSGLSAQWHANALTRETATVLIPNATTPITGLTTTLQPSS